MTFDEVELDASVTYKFNCSKCDKTSTTNRDMAKHLYEHYVEEGLFGIDVEAAEGEEGDIPAHQPRYQPDSLVRRYDSCEP
jgi:hypothetical protein